MLILGSFWVVFSDLFYRRIQNKVVIALLLFWLASVVSDAFLADSFTSEYIKSVLYTVLGALIVFLSGYGIFALGRMGAGDVKFISVMCLWVGFDQQLVFLIITSLAGGALALCLPLLDYGERLLAKPIVWLANRFPDQVPMPTTYDAQRPVGIPYGLAISFGVVVCTLFKI